MPHRIIWSWYTGRWWVGCYIWYSEEGTGRGRFPPSPLLAVPNVTDHPSAASVPITVLLYSGPLPCGFNSPINGLMRYDTTAIEGNVSRRGVDFVCVCWFVFYLYIVWKQSVEPPQWNTVTTHIHVERNWIKHEDKRNVKSRRRITIAYKLLATMNTFRPMYCCLCEF